MKTGLQLQRLWDSPIPLLFHSPSVRPVRCQLNLGGPPGRFSTWDGSLSFDTYPPSPSRPLTLEIQIYLYQQIPTDLKGFNIPYFFPLFPLQFCPNSFLSCQFIDVFRKRFSYVTQQFGCFQQQHSPVGRSSHAMYLEEVLSLVWGLSLTSLIRWLGKLNEKMKAKDLA